MEEGIETGSDPMKEGADGSGFLLMRFQPMPPLRGNAGPNFRLNSLGTDKTRLLASSVGNARQTGDGAILIRVLTALYFFAIFRVGLFQIRRP